MCSEVLVRHPHATGRVYDEEGLIIQSETGRYHVTNAVGARVWDLIDGTRTVGEITRIIVEEYEVSPEQAAADVKEFVADLRKHEVIR